MEIGFISSNQNSSTAAKNPDYEKKVEVTQEYIEFINSLMKGPKKYVANKSSKILVQFLRSSLFASQAYGKMFNCMIANEVKEAERATKGKEANEGKEASEGKEANKTPHSLAPINTMRRKSTESLEELKEQAGPLNEAETVFLNMVCQMEWLFIHRSHCDLQEEYSYLINIFSNHMLTEKNITCSKESTYEPDKEMVGNNDFVFFIAAPDGTNFKLSRHLSVSLFGNNRYIFSAKNKVFNNAFMTFVDQGEKSNIVYTPRNCYYANPTRPVRNDLSESTREFVITQEIHNFLKTLYPGEKKDFPHHENMFCYQDMNEAIGYVMIIFSRYIRCEGDKQNKTAEALEFNNYMLNPKLTKEQFYSLLNCLFFLEIHVPRMVSTVDVKKERCKATNFWEM